MRSHLHQPNLSSAPGVAYEQKLAAKAYANMVARQGFHVPTTPYEQVNAERANALGLVYSCNVGGRQGYCSNLNGQA